MIDWLTIVLELPEHLWARASARSQKGWQVQKVNPVTGEIAWATTCRETVRSDDHQVTVQVTPSRVRIEGSPARSMGLAHNVWGSDDLVECGRAHLRLARLLLPDLPLPGLGAWKITRVDKTENYAFGAAAEVRQALGYLRQYDGGRYRIDTRRGETVYWSPGSALRGGKAYHKGPHLRYMVMKGNAEATLRELELAELLLRLELRFGKDWWRRLRASGGNQWRVDLDAEYRAYWSGLIGHVEVAEMGERELIQKVAKTPGLALAAYRTWCVVKSVGHREASESMPARTWYLHKSILNKAGLSWGDLAMGQVVPFRRRALILEQPAKSWADVEAFLQEQEKAA